MTQCTREQTHGQAGHDPISDPTAQQTWRPRLGNTPSTSSAGENSPQRFLANLWARAGRPGFTASSSTSGA
eukprot:8700526-Pyramimonas_sp.AAC.1